MSDLQELIYSYCLYKEAVEYHALYRLFHELMPYLIEWEGELKGLIQEGRLEMEQRGHQFYIKGVKDDARIVAVD